MATNNMSFVFYRFISSLDQMKPGGQVVADRLEVDFWRKRYIYLEWITRMDNYQLELCMIGTAPTSRPFHNDYDPGQLSRIRDFNRFAVARFSWLPTRALLVEEVYSSITELEEYTRAFHPKANA